MTNPNVARAVWFERPGVASIRDEPLEEPQRGEVLVRALASGISAGTERLVLSGRVPASIRGVMALPSQRGSFDLPISYGYAAVGRVEAIGPEAPPELLGQTVFALHPHHDRFVLQHSELKRLPPDLPPARATLAANLETALNAVWDAEIALGELVVVAGLGVVGLLVAHLAARAGARVIAVDTDERRSDLAQKLGPIESVTSLDKAPLSSADVLFEASGSPAALAGLLDSAGLDARVIVVSWYGERDVPLPLGGRFHPNRVTLRSSQVAHLPPARRARFDHARRFSVVVDLLSDPRLDQIIAPPIRFADAPRVYAMLASAAPFFPPHLVLDATS